MVTATTSWTVPSGRPSLICIAASIAWVSNGLRFFSPLRSSLIVFGSIRFSTAASGTSFTSTQIFKARVPFVGPAGGRSLADYTHRLTGQSRHGAACQAKSFRPDRPFDEFDDVLCRGPRGEHLGDPELLQLRDVVPGD